MNLTEKEEIVEKGSDNVCPPDGVVEQWEALNEIADWFKKWFGSP